jgi:hypothetical protein
MQNVLTAHRYDLIEHGVLFPLTGTSNRRPMRTREGAQSGHVLFTMRRVPKELVAQLLEEVPPTVSTVLLSAEDFTNPRVAPEQHIELFSAFRTIKVVLVLRRQDVWIESFYKQVVDQYSYFETRSFGEYLAQDGRSLLDFYARFSPWRDLVGPENFRVMSYDDMPDGDAICRSLLGVAGVAPEHLGAYPGIEAPPYYSVRSIDTVGLRILNGYRVQSHEIRDKAAREIYAAAPAGDIELLTPEMRAGIQARCAAINERIEAEWFTEPVPGFKFGVDAGGRPVSPPSATEMVEYLDRVIDLADTARAAADSLVAEQEAATAAAAAALGTTVPVVATAAQNPAAVTGVSG